MASLIVSFSLLGFAFLQVNSLRTTHNAFYETRASGIAFETIELIRENPEAVASYLVDSKDYDCTARDSSNICLADTYTKAACTSAQMALHDVFVGICGYKKDKLATGGIRNEIPNGHLVIQCVAADGSLGNDCSESTVNVLISWDEQLLMKSDIGSVARTFSMHGAI